MATPTLTTDIVVIAYGNYTTDAGSWSGGKLGGGATSVPFYVEGTDSVEYQANKGSVLYDYTFTPTTAIPIGQSSVLRMYFCFTEFFRLDSKANNGWKVFATSAAGTGSYTYDGLETYPGGWKQTVVDTGLTPTAGTNPFSADITSMGFEATYTVDGKSVPSMWIDFFTYGNVVNGYGGTSGDEIDLEGIASADLIQAYGIIQKDVLNNVFKMRGELNIGDSAGTATTYFLIENQVVVGEALEFIDIDILQFNFVGNATGVTDIQILGCFISAADKRMAMECSDTNIDSLDFIGNTFGNITGMSFQSGHVITGNVFAQCYQVTPNSATFADNTFNGSPDTDGALRWTSDCTAESCKFNDNLRAIVVPAAVTSVDLDAMSFSGNTVDIYWEGTGGTLTVNLLNGSNASVSGSAGGTVNFVTAPVTTTITVKDLSTATLQQNARVYLVTDSGGPITAGTVIFNDLTDVNGEVSDTRSIASNQPVSGWVRKSSGSPYYKTSVLSGTINSQTGLDLTALLVKDE